MEKIEIFKYHPDYKKYFKYLNMEWLQKFFVIEPIDEIVLSNPEEILNKGGQIFFAKLNDEVVGTCALLKLDDNLYELAKMAVRPEAQGKKIGKTLAIYAINYAKEEGVKEIVLESNTILKTAINLYYKLGFKEVPGYVSSKYIRSNIKMKLNLQ